MAKDEARETAKSLGHHLSEFEPYGTKERAYCLAPACKASVIIQNGRPEDSALSRVCPF